MRITSTLFLLCLGLLLSDCSRLERSKISNAACFGGKAAVQINDRSASTNVASSGFSTNRVILIKERTGAYSVTISECPETGSIQKVLALSLTTYPKAGDLLRLTSNTVASRNSATYTELLFNGDSLNASAVEIWSGAGTLRVVRADNETFELRSEGPIVFNAKSNTKASGNFSMTADITYDIRATIKP